MGIKVAVRLRRPREVDAGVQQERNKKEEVCKKKEKKEKEGAEKEIRHE